MSQEDMEHGIAKSHPAKKVRAKYQERMHGSQRSANSQEPIVLERGAVNNTKEYKEMIKEVEKQFGHHNLKTVKVTKLDRVLVHLMEEKHFEGTDNSYESKLLAAVAWAEPKLSHRDNAKLVRSLKGAKGFRKMAPSHSHSPFPMMVVSGTAMIARQQEMENVALAILLPTHLYLRPGEVELIRWTHFTPPQGIAGIGNAGRTLTLHLRDEGIP